MRWSHMLCFQLTNWIFVRLFARLLNWEHNYKIWNYTDHVSWLSRNYMPLIIAKPWVYKHNSLIRFGMRWINLTYINACTHQANKGLLSKLFNVGNQIIFIIWMFGYNFNCYTTHKDEFTNKVGMNVRFSNISGRDDFDSWKLCVG